MVMVVVLPDTTAVVRDEGSTPEINVTKCARFDKLENIIYLVLVHTRYRSRFVGHKH